MVRKKSSARKKVVKAGLTAVAGTALLGILLNQTTYTVIRVMDGDTFETAEHQYVRLNGIQAPEPGLCGADESKAALSRIILGQRVFMKTVYFDQYNRLISNVYTLKGQSVRHLLAEQGHAIVYQRGETDDTLFQASAKARTAKKGVFGTCVETINRKNPSCRIKGNLGEFKRLMYHLPECPDYGKTAVELYKGDRWFCSESDAQKAGYIKASACP